MLRLGSVCVFVGAMVSLLSITHAETENGEMLAVTRLQELGVKFVVDEKDPGKPTVEADFAGLRAECTVKDLALVRQLRFLRAVTLKGDRTTDDILIEHMTALKGLESVTLISMWATNATIERLSKLAGLRQLDISLCYEVDDEGLKHLKNLKNLERLSVNDVVKASDAWLADLDGTKLRDLDLSRMGVTDRGVGLLAKLPALEHLDLYSSDVTNACLKHLLAMPKLRSVSLESTKVTAAAVEALREAKPELRINY